MSVRTDLAAETVGEGKIRGVELETENICGIEITHITIDETAAENINRAAGNYYTLFCPVKNKEAQIKALSEVLKRILPGGGALVAGLGNNDITPDSLGPKTVSDVLATRHFSYLEKHGLPDLREVTVIQTGVTGQTGMESSELICAAAKGVNPTFALAVDSLACSDLSRLGTTIQITDTGISPGSGVQNKRKELSHKTLGIPCIAIGVPTVIDLNSLTGDKSAPGISDSMMVTPRDIDNVINHYGTVLSASINTAFHPNLSSADISALLC